VKNIIQPSNIWGPLFQIKGANQPSETGGKVKIIAQSSKA